MVGPDDKGIIDFVKASFVLFGYRIESVVILYWAALGSSCLLFVLSFGRKPWALALVVAFLLAHHSVLPIVALNPQLKSVVMTRFMSVLGMVATLHLILETVSQSRRGAARFAALVMQTVILILMLYTRFSTIWEVFCVCASFVGVTICWWEGYRGEEPARRILTAAVPAILVLTGSFALRFYKQAAISPKYYAEGGASHVFWHSAFGGLAFSPELAKEYDIRIDDVSVIFATRRFLLEHGNASRWARIQSDKQYDAAVRDMFLATCRERPEAMLLLVVYHKPLALARFTGWLMRTVPEAPLVNVLWPTSDKELQVVTECMDREDKSLRLFRPECIVVLAIFVLSAHCGLCRHWRKIAVVLALLVPCSLMPSLLGYPTPHTISDALVGMGMFAYLAGMLAASALLIKCHGRKGGQKAICTKSMIPLSSVLAR